ncbi:MAG: cryptochrome/photolyase family protein [Anaerolineae bacterium]
MTAIWWIRRDLRLDDNPALHRAVRDGGTVIPLFVLDPALLDSNYVGEKRLGFLYAGLEALGAALRDRGSRLVLRAGSPVEVLRDLVGETGAESIYAQADVSPYATRRDDRVSEELPLKLTGGLTIHPFDAVRKQDGDPYVVYTPYKRSWRELPLPEPGDILPAPSTIPGHSDLPSDAIPDTPRLPDDADFKAGEAEARRRLEQFADDMIYAYDDRRDRVDLDGTSRLSPYLRFGMISARRAAVAALEAKRAASSDQAREGAQTWLDELIWREFYISVLHHFPEVREQSFREDYRDLAWDNDEEAFAAWQRGETGFPIVDAGMRQLLATGWMHNRARMIVASFLTKDLLIDWRWGERHFMQHLIDGDPAANNGGWQWSAGTGTDAAPYFRIFNPILQGEKHDPQGEYIRRWVPELEPVDDQYIHRPWSMPEDVQQQVGCVIGRDYPARIIDHQQARERALAAYKAARETS